MTLVKNVGALVSLADGSIMVPGSRKDLTREQLADPHNQSLLAEGHLITVKAEVEEPKKKEGGDK